LTLPFALWELSVVEQRYGAVVEVPVGVPVTEVAGQYGVTRKGMQLQVVKLVRLLAEAARVPKED
jgi:hypothetical protein